MTRTICPFSINHFQLFSSPGRKGVVTAVVEFSQPVRHVRSRLALPGKLESDVSASYGRLTNVLSTSSSPI
jgi:hypothetical protein